MGRTLHFHNARTGDLVGIEEFLRRDLSVWRRANGVCVYGRITIEAGQLCFLYEDETPDEKTCWFVLEDRGELFVRTTEMLNAEIQKVEKISDDPLNCPNAPTS